MKIKIAPFREVLGFWNETGLILSVCLSIGYFGTRQLLGRLPLLLAVILAISSLVLAFFLRHTGQPQQEDWMNDEGSDREVMRFVFLAICFLVGLGGFMFLGSLV